MSVASFFNGWMSSRPMSVGSENDEITAGDFRLCVETRQAFVNSQRLSLSAAEFDLLRFLLTHRKMLVTPQTMLSTACDKLRIRRTEFIKTLLTLKNKLDDACGAGRYLHVEPWVVYQFNPNHK